MGRDGFYWWQGVVEDRMDPLMVGRCRVRILGLHTDDKSSKGIPTNDLPWATLLLPANQEERIVPPKEGSWVLGFFRDGTDCQDPVILGVLPGIPVESNPNLSGEQKGFFDPAITLESRPVDMETGFVANIELKDNEILRSDDVLLKGSNAYPKHVGEPDTHRLARCENLDKTILQWKVNNRIEGVLDNKTRTDENETGAVTTSSWDEPNPVDIYAAVYPYNKVMASESGHIIEIDDTPEHERIHIFHRSGTFDEMQPNGDRVMKTFGNSYRITYLDDYYLCLGSKHETYGGDKCDQYYKQRGEIVGEKRYIYAHNIDTKVCKLSAQNYIGKSYYLTVENNDGANDENAINVLAESGNIRITSRNSESGEIHLKSDYEIKFDAASQVQTLSLGQINTQALVDQTHMAGGVFKVLAGAVIQIDSGKYLQIQSHDYASIKGKNKLELASPNVNIDGTTEINISGGKIYLNCDAPVDPNIVILPGVPVTPAISADHSNIGDENIAIPSSLNKG